jgi:hypothetical protein
MNKKVVSAALLGAITFQSTSKAATREVKLQEVVEHVSHQNFEVLTNALRVYQAKENIQVARGNLLPRLNVWKIIGFVVDPIGVIEDIVPFLVPANWFRVEQAKILHLAQKEGYRALWGNQLLTAKALYFQILGDEAFLRALELTARELQDIENVIVGREMTGAMPRGSGNAIRLKRLQIEDDVRDVRVLVVESRNALAQGLGMPLPVDLSLEPVSAPNWGSLEFIIPEEFEFRADDISPERRQFEQFVRVVPLIKDEIYFSFLGVSSSSRGSAGGIFDHLPVVDGLGFGSSAAVRIVSTEEEILKIQTRGIQESLKRDLWNLAARYNGDIESSRNIDKRERLASEQWNRMKTMLLLGEDVDLMEMQNASEAKLGSAVSRSRIDTRHHVLSDRFRRLLFGGDYTKEPAAIEEIKKGKPL